MYKKIATAIFIIVCLWNQAYSMDFQTLLNPKSTEEEMDRFLRSAYSTQADYYAAKNSNKKTITKKHTIMCPECNTTFYHSSNKQALKKNFKKHLFTHAKKKKVNEKNNTFYKNLKRLGKCEGCGGKGFSSKSDAHSAVVGHIVTFHMDVVGESLNAYCKGQDVDTYFDENVDRTAPAAPIDFTDETVATLTMNALKESGVIKHGNKRKLDNENTKGAALPCLKCGRILSTQLIYAKSILEDSWKQHLYWHATKDIPEHRDYFENAYEARACSFGNCKQPFEVKDCNIRAMIRSHFLSHHNKNEDSAIFMYGGLSIIQYVEKYLIQEKSTDDANQE